VCDCILFVFELRTGLRLELCTRDSTNSRSSLPLPRLVPQGYSTLFVSIFSGESKELITMIKAQGYSGKKASGLISTEDFIGI